MIFLRLDISNIQSQFKVNQKTLGSAVPAWKNYEEFVHVRKFDTIKKNIFSALWSLIFIKSFKMRWDVFLRNYKNALTKFSEMCTEVEILREI